MIINAYLRDQERRGLRASTIERTRIELRCFESEYQLFQVTTEDLERFLDSRHGRDGGPISPGRRRGWIGTFRAFYSWAVSVGYTALNPAARLRRPRARKAIPRPHTDADVTMALRLATPLMYCWVALAAYGGLRCCEIAWLEVDGIQPGWLRLEGKGGKIGMVPIHPIVEEGLRIAPTASAGRVFRRRDGAPFTPRNVSENARAYLHGIGLTGGLHRFRHWTGTTVYKQTRDVMAVKQMLRHEDIRTGHVYTQVEPTVAAEAVALLPVLI